MATKKQTSPAKKTSVGSSKSTVTRIKAVDTASNKKGEKTASQTKTVTKTKAKRRGLPLGGVAKPFTGAIGYFKGAWYELKQVRWPTRGATWGLTGAVIAFSLFFVVLILLLDAAFKYLFDVILGK